MNRSAGGGTCPCANRTPSWGGRPVAVPGGISVVDGYVEECQNPGREEGCESREAPLPAAEGRQRGDRRHAMSGPRRGCLGRRRQRFARLRLPELLDELLELSRRCACELIEVLVHQRQREGVADRTWTAPRRLQA